MSNGLAVATVTQALALLIESNLRPEIDMAVSVETRKPPAEPPTEPTITVFLYQLTPNASLRNSDLPTRASDGTLLRRAAAALDLHFLISAYGEETELVGQRLIGCVVRTLHELPLLSRELIEEAAQRPYLAGSDLAESIQKVRFSPTQMDVDETSKLWGMLHQTPYSLSVVYQASLVLIEGREQPVPAKPVERRTVRVLPLGASEAAGAEAAGASEEAACAEAAGASEQAAGAEAAGPGTGTEVRGGAARDTATRPATGERGRAAEKSAARRRAGQGGSAEAAEAAEETAVPRARKRPGAKPAKSASPPACSRKASGGAPRRGGRSGPAADGDEG
ncbi:DUF4255 domain-containing protein [Streptomyces pathocidini]|uniref:DUF4255 domain-containing protein n=1 Tax=Streptomyces pathocidini TaxID=1650571 RepID=UPI0033D0B7D2